MNWFLKSVKAREKNSLSISNNKITSEKKEEKSRKERKGEGQEEGAQIANKN